MGVSRPGRLPSLSPISKVENSENGGKTGKNSSWLLNQMRPAMGARRFGEYASEPVVIDTLRVINSGGRGYPVTDLFAIAAGLLAILTHRMLLMFLALGFAVTADAADDLGQVLHVR